MALLTSASLITRNSAPSWKVMTRRSRRDRSQVTTRSLPVFNITHNIYDTAVSPDLSLGERANTRGNNYKLHIILSITIYESIFFLCTHCKYLEQLA